MNDNKKLINLQLFGGHSIFTDKVHPIRAVSTFCTADSCSFLNQGKCLSVSSLNIGGNRCKYAKEESVEVVGGRDCQQFNDVRNSEFYGKISEVGSQRIGYINDDAVINLGYLQLEVEEDYVRLDFYTLSKLNYIPRDMLTVENLHLLAEADWNLEWSGTQKDHYEQNLPELFCQLRELDEELFNAYIKQYPETKLDYSRIGKEAYIRTMVEGSVIKSPGEPEFTLRNGKLYCENTTKRLPLNIKSISANIELTIADDATYRIDSNDQWDENTIFV